MGATTNDLPCVEISEVRDMIGSGEDFVIRTVTGEELLGRRPWCARKSEVAWLAHGVKAIRRWTIAGRLPFRTREDRVTDDARLDLALEMTFPASDPVAVSSWGGETPPDGVDSEP
jgi:hypothetical protein